MAEEFAFQRDDDGTLTLEAAVGQALGAASMCWSNVRAAGEFDSQRASRIIDALVVEIAGYGHTPGPDHNLFQCGHPFCVRDAIAAGA